MLATLETHHSTATANGDGAESNDLKHLVEARKADLQAQLKALDSPNIDKLLHERETTALRLAEIDAQIADLRQQLGLPAPKTGRRAGARAPGAAPRTRMGSMEIRNRILKALAEAKYGMSQKDISERTAIPYGTVAAYLKTNQETFKTTGQLKGKRYFLK